MELCYNSSMDRLSVFIDESGTLPDPHDKIIIIAAVVSKHPERIDSILKRIKRRGKLRKQTGELKFYTAGDKTKIAFFELFAQEKFSVFVLAVDKMGRKIPDTPEHFSLLCWLLLTDVLSFHPITDIILDRHFSRKSDQQAFNQLLTKLFDIEFDIIHVDSKKHKRVNIADMVAGAVLAKETGKSDQFYKLIEKQVISFKKLNWVEAKRRLFV